MGSFLPWPDVNANSYLNLTDANTYFEFALGATDWSNATDATKQSALVTATRMADRKDWQGDKTVTTQPLEWPRTGVVDKDGESVSTTTLPQDFQDGICELALELITDPDVQTTTAASAKSMRADKTSVEFFSPSNQRVSGAIFPGISQELLGQYLLGPAGLVPTASGTDVESEFDADDQYDKTEGLA